MVISDLIKVELELERVVDGIEATERLDHGQVDPEADGRVAALDPAYGPAAEVRALGELVDAEVLLLAERGELGAQLGCGAAGPYRSRSRCHVVTRLRGVDGGGSGSGVRTLSAC